MTLTQLHHPGNSFETPVIWSHSAKRGPKVHQLQDGSLRLWSRYWTDNFIARDVQLSTSFCALTLGWNCKWKFELNETKDILSKVVVVSDDVCDSTIVRAKCGTVYTNWPYIIYVWRWCVSWLIWCVAFPLHYNNFILRMEVFFASFSKQLLVISLSVLGPDARNGENPTSS